MAGDMGTNLTRRDALRRGTLLGAGAVWAAPAVRTLTMSSNFAAATSPVVGGEEVETTTTTVGETPTTTGQTPTTAGETPTTAGQSPATTAQTPTTAGASTGTIPTEVEGVVVTQAPGGSPQGPPIVSADQLPLTGVEARGGAVLGAGLLAVGAAIVAATKEDGPERPQSD